MSVRVAIELLLLLVGLPVLRITIMIEYKRNRLLVCSSYCVFMKDLSLSPIVELGPE